MGFFLDLKTENSVFIYKGNMKYLDSDFHITSLIIITTSLILHIHWYTSIQMITTLCKFNAKNGGLSYLGVGSFNVKCALKIKVFDT